MKEPITPTLDTEFTELFLRGLMESRKEHERKERTSLYVSEIGTIQGESACWRKLWYAVNEPDAATPLSPETMLAFEIGDVIGLRAANILAKTGLVQRVELPLDFEPFPLRGRLDVLSVPLMRRVIEVKSAPARQKPYLPKQDHIDQLNLYLHRVRQEPEYEDYEGVLLYIIKDATKGQPVLQAYQVLYDAAGAERALGNSITAWQATKDAVPPERPAGFTLTKFPCGYCQFAHHCWSGKL